MDLQQRVCGSPFHNFVILQVKAYRFVAYSAVTFSVVSILSVCVTLPLVYNYVHLIKRNMQQEVLVCRVSI